MDVRESEQIDKQVNLALLNTQQQANEVKQETIEGSVRIEDVEMSEEVKVDEINVEMED
jgi:ribosome-binding factor A